MRRSSIRVTLLVWLLASLGIGLIGAAAAVYSQAREDANELFDFHLREVVASLPRRSFPAILGDDSAVLEDGTVIQIWDQDGGQLYFSHPRARLPARAELGFATVQTPQGQWRVFSAIVGSNVVQAAQPMRVRRQMAAEVALRTTLPFLFILPMFGVAIVVLVRRGLAPLDRLARDVGRRSERSLEPVPEGGVPDEVRPVVASLNALLARLSRSLDAQRAFVADAAHELRTPLTALKLQMQLLGRARSEAERGEAIAALGAGLERASRLVEQLLTLARQEPSAAESRKSERCDLVAIAGEAVAARAQIAAARGIDLGLKRADPAAIDGDTSALATLLGNLIDNALRHAPAGSAVDVAVEATGSGAVLEVADRGPGIAPAERTRVFDRFYRGADTSGNGSGLGLSIVKGIADAHAASVELIDRAGGGLSVQVRFPASRDDPAPPPATPAS